MVTEIGAVSLRIDRHSVGGSGLALDRYDIGQLLETNNDTTERWQVAYLDTDMHD
jgi:hypothetical protein